MSAPAPHGDAHANDPLEQDYASAGFGGRLSPGRKAALLIVDMVMAYLDPASPLYAHGEDALVSSLRLLSAAREAGAPVVFTNVVYEADGANGGIFYRKVPALKAFVCGSPLGAFGPGLDPRAGELVLSKQYPSAFFGTPLASTLHAMGVDTVVMTGYSTSGCIRASALDALQHGFIPIVCRDACADRAIGPHESNLFDMQAKMAEVVDEAEAISIVSRKSL